MHGPGSRMRCFDGVSVLLMKGLGAAPATVKFGLKLKQLTLDPPLAGPVRTRLVHDGVGRRGSISACTLLGTTLRCAAP